MNRSSLRRRGVGRSPLVVLLLCGALVFSAASARAENRCAASVTRQGKKFDLRNCAVAYYSSEHSVMIWFTENPLSSGEEKSFRISPSRRSAISTGST